MTGNSGAVQPGRHEMVDILHLPEFPGLELVHASFVTRNFPRHSHENFWVGIIERGAVKSFFHGENIVAPAGTIGLINPDEVHTGQPAADDGWAYRLFYLPADLLQQAAENMADRSTNLPFFISGAVEDHNLAVLIRHVHLQLNNPQTPRLAKEILLLRMLALLIARYAHNPPAICKVGSEHAAVKRVIDYLDSYFAEDVSIDTLAALARLSPYHFIRVFTRQTGLTPHAWLIQLRVRKAREMLRQGLPIIDTAILTGFSDQSHLTRTFKRLLGYTPGQFNNSLQKLRQHWFQGGTPVQND